VLGEERKHANIPIAWMNRPIYILCVYSIDHWNISKVSARIKLSSARRNNNIKMQEQT
jgi:hypothetical protein